MPRRGRSKLTTEDGEGEQEEHRRTRGLWHGPAKSVQAPMTRSLTESSPRRSCLCGERAPVHDGADPHVWCRRQRQALAETSGDVGSVLGAQSWHAYWFKLYCKTQSPRYHVYVIIGTGAGPCGYVIAAASSIQARLCEGLTHKAVSCPARY